MFAPHPDGVILSVWVVPGSSRDEIVGRYGDAMRVRTTAPPQDGRANDAVARILADALDATVSLVAGASSRAKRYLVAGVTVGHVASRLPS